MSLGCWDPLEPLDQRRWLFGWEAYRAVNPHVELDRVRLLDRVGTLLSAVQWLQWLVLQPRAFSAPQRIGWSSVGSVCATPRSRLKVERLRKRLCGSSELDKGQSGKSGQCGQCGLLCGRYGDQLYGANIDQRRMQISIGSILSECTPLVVMSIVPKCRHYKFESVPFRALRIRAVQCFQSSEPRVWHGCHLGPFHSPARPRH
ncbi:MAG: hypothetical protein R3C56_36000 [Pirellulaceae bacterium]